MAPFFPRRVYHKPGDKKKIKKGSSILAFLYRATLMSFLHGVYKLRRHRYKLLRRHRYIRFGAHYMPAWLCHTFAAAGKTPKPILGKHVEGKKDFHCLFFLFFCEKQSDFGATLSTEQKHTGGSSCLPFKRAAPLPCSIGSISVHSLRTIFHQAAGVRCVSVCMLYIYCHGCENTVENTSTGSGRKKSPLKNIVNTIFLVLRLVFDTSYFGVG